MIDDMKLHALEKVMKAGRKGLLVERGYQTHTQMSLVEDGLLWQEVKDRCSWKFTLSPSGQNALDAHHKIAGRPVPHHGPGPDNQ